MTGAKRANKRRCLNELLIVLCIHVAALLVPHAAFAADDADRLPDGPPLMILAWAALGPAYGWPEGHQLFINTITTIVTFLIVFLIQNTQNRDTKALHLKIDELLKATRGARNSMIDLDRLSDEQLRRLEAEFKRICAADSDKTA
jgi:hypothetical protein